MNNDATLHIRLSSAMKKELEEKADEFSVKPAVIIRTALEEYLERNPEPTTRINIGNF